MNLQPALARLERKVARLVARTAPARRDTYDLARLTSWERAELGLIEPWARKLSDLSDGELDATYRLLRKAARQDEPVPELDLDRNPRPPDG